MKVPGRPRPTPTTPAALPDQPYLLMAAAHMQATQGNVLNPQALPNAPVQA